MPVLRSSKGQQSEITDAFPPKKSFRKVNNKSANASSSSTRVHSKPAKRNQETAAGDVRHPPAGEVIEILSDSDDDSDRVDLDQSTFVRNLRKQIAELRDENTAQKRDLEKYKQSFSKGKVTLDIKNVEESFNCEICIGRMWSPYLLPDCGHTFCQSCLQDWFTATLAKFTAEHPNYDPSQLDWRFDLRTRLMFPNIPNLLTALPTSNAPRPCYSCPTCRRPVSIRPVEVYALKTVVRCFASAVGEQSPQKDRIIHGSRKTPGNPWDRFFPLQRDMA